MKHSGTGSRRAASASQAFRSTRLHPDENHGDITVLRENGGCRGRDHLGSARTCYLLPENCDENRTIDSALICIGLPELGTVPLLDRV